MLRIQLGVHKNRVVQIPLDPNGVIMGKLDGKVAVITGASTGMALVLQGVIVRRYEVSAGHGLIAGRGDRTDPRLAPAVGRGHLVGPGGVAWRYGDCRINDPVTRVLP